MKKFLTALALGLAMMTAVPAQAQLRITFDPGGVISEFIDKYDAIQRSGGKVIIDGHCISACTLVTALVDNENVCITKRARLGFHSATARTPISSTYSKEATEMLWGLFPENVRLLVNRVGWDGISEHPAIVYVENAALRTLYRECDG